MFYIFKWFLNYLIYFGNAILKITLKKSYFWCLNISNGAKKNNYTFIFFYFTILPLIPSLSLILILSSN